MSAMKMLGLCLCFASSASAGSYAYFYESTSDCVTVADIVKVQVVPVDTCFADMSEDQTVYRKYTCSGSDPNDVVSSWEYSDDSCSTQVSGSQMIHGDTGNLVNTEVGNKNACLANGAIKEWWSCTWEGPLPAGWFVSGTFDNESSTCTEESMYDLWMYKLNDCYPSASEEYQVNEILGTPLTQTMEDGSVINIPVVGRTCTDSYCQNCDSLEEGNSMYEVDCVKYDMRYTGTICSNGVHDVASCDPVTTDSTDTDSDSDSDSSSSSNDTPRPSVKLAALTVLAVMLWN